MHVLRPTRVVAYTPLRIPGLFANGLVDRSIGSLSAIELVHFERVRKKLNFRAPVTSSEGYFVPHSCLEIIVGDDFSTRIVSCALLLTLIFRASRGVKRNIMGLKALKALLMKSSALAVMIPRSKRCTMLKTLTWHYRDS